MKTKIIKVKGNVGAGYTTQPSSVLKITNNEKVGIGTDKYFLKVGLDLIKEDVKVGDIFGLEVSEVGEQIVFQLKRIEDSTKDAEETPFKECFTQNWDGSLEFVRTLKIGALKSYKGTTISKGVIFGGIDLQLFIGRNLSVIKQPDCWTIVGIY